jgi:hypothetical protein
MIIDSLLAEARGPDDRRAMAELLARSGRNGAAGLGMRGARSSGTRKDAPE